MAHIIVRNLEKIVSERLRAQAKANGRSIEEELRQIIRKSVLRESAAPNKLCSLMVERFSGIGLDEDLELLPRQEARAAEFDE